MWARYWVRDLLCSEADWSWVLLQLADEGLPVTKVPRSPQRLALQWQTFFDATVERRLTHAPDPVLARHVANLSLISGPSGLRPDLDVAAGPTDRGGARRDDRLRRRHAPRACRGTDDHPADRGGVTAPTNRPTRSWLWRHSHPLRFAELTFVALRGCPGGAGPSYVKAAWNLPEKDGVSVEEFMQPGPATVRPPREELRGLVERMKRVGVKTILGYVGGGMPHRHGEPK